MKNKEKRKFNYSILQIMIWSTILVTIIVAVKYA